MRPPTRTLLLLSLGVANAKLLIDYTGGQPASTLGNVELEGQDLGCKITSAGDAVFIKPEPDSSNSKPSLHYKRDPHFRRAEVKSLGQGSGKEVQAGKTYFIGYNFRLSTSANSLVIFQWKKWDKEAEPKQNIPFHLVFNSNRDLTLEYTTPGSNGSNRSAVWTGPLSVGTGTEHKLAFAINTSQGGAGWLEFYVDGQKQNFNKVPGSPSRLTNVELFTGPTSPKFGIYRAEIGPTQGQGDKFCPASTVYTGDKAPSGSPGIYNSWIYRVQISDSSLQEVAEAGGV